MHLPQQMARLDASPVGDIASGDFKRDVLLERGLQGIVDAYKAHKEVCYLQLAWLALTSNLRLAGSLAALEARARARSWLQWLQGDRQERTIPVLPWLGGGMPWKATAAPFPLMSGLTHPSPTWYPIQLWRPRLPKRLDAGKGEGYYRGYSDAMREHCVPGQGAANLPPSGGTVRTDTKGLTTK